MESLAWLFVGKPLHIAAVAVAFFIGFLALRGRAASGSRNPRAVLVAAAGWLVGLQLLAGNQNRK